MAQSPSLFEKVVELLESTAEAGRASADKYSALAEEGPHSFFESMEEPSISVGAFIRIVRTLGTDEDWACGLVLLQRLVEKTNVPLSPFNAHRLIVAACLISVKMHQETRRVGYAFSKRTGISMEEMFAMEAALLQLLDWEVFVTKQHIAPLLPAPRPC
eukprot:Hpha_TRINITY_DN13877_c0_g1::TRINITY_DN13877_c0_g1_i1::g.69563::m.69563